MRKYGALLVFALLSVSFIANAGVWTFRSAGAASFTTDNQAPGSPAGVTVGDVVLIFTQVQSSGVARTLSTPSGWTLLLDIASSDTTQNGKIFCRVWQMGDSLPVLDWSSSNNTTMQATAWSGPTAPDCTTMLHTSVQTKTNGATWATGALTITQDNTLVIKYTGKINGEDGSSTAYGTLTCPTGVAGGNPMNRSQNTSFLIQWMGCYVIQTTATNVANNVVSISGTQENSSYVYGAVSLLQQDSVVPPTFTANPDIGTRTTSSIPITATSACTDCTLYVVAVTDGSGAPTAAQIKAGQDSSGSAAYKSCSAAMTSTVQATCTLSSYTDGTVRDGYAVMESTANSFSSVYGSGNLVDMFKLPAFPTALTVASTSATAYTSNSKLLDGAGTVTWVRCAYGASAPTVAQVEAHSGGCITDYATDDASGSMSLSIAGLQPDGDLFYVGAYGGQHEASVHSILAQCLSAQSGFQLIGCPTGITSLAAGSPLKAFNDATIVTLAYGSQTVNFTLHSLVLGGTSGAYGTIELDSDSGSTGTLTINTLSGTFQSGELLTDNFGGSAISTGAPSNYTDIATGDIPQIPSTVQPSAAALTVGLDGQYSYSAVGRQTALNGLIFDASADAYLTLDLDFVANNASPVCGGAPVVLVLATNLLMTPLDLNTGCSDLDIDALTWAGISGALPAGLSMDATTGLISGTPTVQDLVGVDLVFIAYDGYGGTTTKSITIVVSTSWPLTDCTSSPTTAISCAIAIDNLTSSSVSTRATYLCNSMVAEGNVISQSPVAGASVSPGDTVTLTVSLGTTCGTVVTPNCLSKLVSACSDILVGLSVYATLVPQIGCVDGSSKIYSQAPAVGLTEQYDFSLFVYCH